MKLFRNMVILLAVLVSSANFSGAQKSEKAWDFPDFTATQAIQTARYEMPMKVYRSGSSVRVEETAALATLFVPASSKVYSLTTYPNGSHVCVSMRPDQAKMLPSPLELLFGTKVKRTPAGTATVEGHQCKVEIAVVTRPDGSPVTSKVWEAEDLKGVPVKIESQFPGFKLTAIYRDIVLGTPDKALVTPPEKCIPFEKMWQVAEEKVIK